jgi:hypothetical protein
VNVPYGYCQCGCGQKTKLAPQSATRSGWIKGEPLRYLLGHSARGRRFHRKVERYKVEDRGYETACWIWQLALKENGYGSVGGPGQRMLYAHRVYYEEANGPIPDGLVIDHLCRQSACVNPDHLEAVTQSENVRRGRRCNAEFGSNVRDLRLEREAGG